MSATKIRSRWVAGLLEFFGITAGTTVLKITESGIEGNLTGNVIGDLTGNVTGNVTGQALKSVAVTATDVGSAIPVGATHVAVTSSNADHIVVLPPPVPGTKITLLNGGTGYELRSSAPATVGINGGTGENAESAVGASTAVIVECVSATNWIGSTVSAAGVVGVLQVAG